MVLHHVRALNQAELALIAQYNGFCVYLIGLNQLDAATAEKLAAWRGERLVLWGLHHTDHNLFEQLRSDTREPSP